MSMLFKRKVILSQVFNTIVLFPEFSPNIIYFKTGNIYVKSLEKTKYSMYYIFEEVFWRRINKFLHDLKLFSFLCKLCNKTRWGMGSASAYKLESLDTMECYATPWQHCGSFFPPLSLSLLFACLDKMTACQHERSEGWQKVPLVQKRAIKRERREEGATMCHIRVMKLMY